MINSAIKVTKSTGIDLRKEYEVLQKQFSIDILYIRTSKYIKCECYNPLHKVGDPSCKKCLGRGYLNTIEKVSAINTSMNYLQDGIISTSIGTINANDESFYFSHKVMPRVGDIVVVATYNSNREPVDVESVFEIHSASPVRGDSGRVEMFASLCKLRADKKEQLGSIIRGLDKVAKIHLSKGKRYIWPMKEK